MSTTETKYQIYTSSMQAHKLIMPCGKVLHVTKGQFVTCDEAEIAFIDAEIKLGFKYLTKGGTTTSATADPMAAYKAKIGKEAIAEYLAKEQAELKQEIPEKKVPEASKVPSQIASTVVKPASTLDLSALKPKSNS